MAPFGATVCWLNNAQGAVVPVRRTVHDRYVPFAAITASGSGFPQPPAAAQGSPREPAPNDFSEASEPADETRALEKTKPAVATEECVRRLFWLLCYYRENRLPDGDPLLEILKQRLDALTSLSTPLEEALPAGSLAP